MKIATKIILSVLIIILIYILVIIYLGWVDGAFELMNQLQPLSLCNPLNYTINTSIK